MKLTTITHVSVDGVVQGNGGRDENRSGGFERGGSARPLFDAEALAFVDEVYQRAAAFLFGPRDLLALCGLPWRGPTLPGGLLSRMITDRASRAISSMREFARRR
jgi:hypothetical protein